MSSTLMEHRPSSIESVDITRLAKPQLLASADPALGRFLEAC